MKTLTTLGLVLPLAAHAFGVADSQSQRPPNFILIVTDNLGYGDIGPFGSKVHRTPCLDRMAAEGMKFTHFCVTAGVCTPSRASFMTGCYAQRVGLRRRLRVLLRGVLFLPGTRVRVLRLYSGLSCGPVSAGSFCRHRRRAARKTPGADGLAGNTVGDLWVPSCPSSFVWRLCCPPLPQPSESVDASDRNGDSGLHTARQDCLGGRTARPGDGRPIRIRVPFNFRRSLCCVLESVQDRETRVEFCGLETSCSCRLYEFRGLLAGTLGISVEPACQLYRCLQTIQYCYWCRAGLRHL